MAPVLACTDSDMAGLEQQASGGTLSGSVVLRVSSIGSDAPDQPSRCMGQAMALCADEADRLGRVQN